MWSIGSGARLEERELWLSEHRGRASLLLYGAVLLCSLGLMVSSIILSSGGPCWIESPMS